MLGGAGEVRREGGVGLRLGDGVVIAAVAVVVGSAEGGLGSGVEVVGLVVGVEVRREDGGEVRCHLTTGMRVHHTTSLGRRNAVFAGAKALMELQHAANEAKEPYVLRTR